MTSNLEFVEYANPLVEERMELPYVTVMSVFWKGLPFLRAVRYLELDRTPPKNYWEDTDDDEDDDDLAPTPTNTKRTGSPSKANNFAGCEDRIYLYSELKHFHLAFDQNIQSLDEAKILAREAEATLVKFARDVHMRPSLRYPRVA